MIPVRIAIAGFGNVGRAFARYTREDPRRFGVDMDLSAVADSTGILRIEAPGDINSLVAHKESGAPIKSLPKSLAVGSHSAAMEMLRADGVRVLVECLPTDIQNGQPGRGLIAAALAAGINVVTVDKGPMVHAFRELTELAQRSNTRLAFSGTTGVCPPEELSGKQVLEIRGVLTGTTNYILTEMQERSLTLDQALAQAQSRGIAEPDPSLDVDGWDTAVKILILAKSLMAAEVDLSGVSRVGLGANIGPLLQTARKTGHKLRLVGRARIWQGRVRVSVAPKLIGPDSPFYAVEGTSKAAIFRTEADQFVAHAPSSRGAICDTIARDIAGIAKSPSSAQ